MSCRTSKIASAIGLFSAALVVMIAIRSAEAETSGTEMVLHKPILKTAIRRSTGSNLMGDLDEAAGHEKKYMLVKKKPKHKKIKMEVFEPKMKYKKIKMKVPVKQMKKKKVKGYLVKKEHGHEY